MLPVKPYFVGITGGSGSGKTTLAKKLKQLANPGELDVIYLDSFYRARDNISFTERQYLNYDHPDAIEFELAAKCISELSQGEETYIPRYDFAQHNRATGQDLFKPHPIIVVESILTFHDPLIRSFFDDLIFVDNPDMLRLERRIERDIKERGRTRESVIEQWNTTVQPAFLEFCWPTKKYARIVVEGVGDYETLVTELLQRYRVCINSQ